ncbi:MAG: OmpA family protein [Deltaproteobacteria bacterium]|nr:OmpA family protein [Deltaproteobacteria bacterium]
MSRRKTEVKGPDSNAWITTFTNLMILLLAFFIILVTMSVADKKKKHVAMNSVLGSFGFKPGGQAVIGSNSGSDITMGEAPIEQEDVDLEQLQNITFASGLESDVRIRREVGRIIITLSNRVLFDKGSSKIPQEGVRFLSDLSGVLKEGPGLIELRGYADYTETVFEPDPANTSMYLSTKRALSVFHFLVDKGKIPAERIVAHGFGMPIKGRGSLKKKKEWKGQVEIIVDYRQEIPYRLRVHKKRERLLDYKGFLFKLFENGDEKS